MCSVPLSLVHTEEKEKEIGYTHVVFGSHL